MLLPGHVTQVVYEVNSLPGSLQSWAATVQADVLEPLQKAQEDWGSPTTQLPPAGQQVCVHCLFVCWTGGGLLVAVPMHCAELLLLATPATSPVRAAVCLHDK
jgi:hypothetical protein